MSKDLQSRATIFRPDSARAGDELKPNQPKDVSYPKRNFSKNGKDERSFLPLWYETWKWLHYNKIDDTVYCIICLNAKRFHMLSDVKVEEAFVKKGSGRMLEVLTRDLIHMNPQDVISRPSIAYRIVHRPELTASSLRCRVSIISLG